MKSHLANSSKMPFAESLGVAALGWVASPVVKDLFDKSKSLLGSNIAESLDDLETTLIPQIQLTIRAAQNSPHKDRLNNWLLRLKNAYYDAEAILHKLEYRHLRRQVKADQKKPRKVRISSHPVIKPLAKFATKLKKKASSLTKPLAKFTGKLAEKVSQLSPRKIKLLNRLNKLKKVAAEARTFRELLQITVPENGSVTLDSNPPTTSSTEHNKVFGRDEDRERIINFLLDMEDKRGSSSSSTLSRSYSVAAITGIGGSGKTTLAKYVYNDERVKRNFTRMWISLSQNMNVIELTKIMIEYITEKRPKLTVLSLLKEHLINALHSQSNGVLLVLDNFWPNDTKAENEDQEWKDLLAPFNGIRGRFKILTTSRSDKFPVPLLPTEPIKLSNLTPADFQSLLKYYAGLEESCPEWQTLHYTIADEIANKLSKSPLSARVVGDQLYKTRDIEFWKDTLRNVNLSDTMEVLFWSYQRMETQLQRCFLFFGVFTRGTLFTAKSLVQFWVALDFIQPSNNTTSAEEVGFKFFNLMISNSMLVESVDGRYRIHDLFHELAEKLTIEDCFRVTDSETAIPSTTVLHVTLSVSNENLKEKLSSISHLRNLRTLLLETPLIGDVNETFSMISKTFKNLRVLEIWSTGYSVLPETVGDMRNLRYLDVDRSSIKELPNSMSRLYHLQYLLLPEFVGNLSATLRNLIKLRSIGIYDRKFNYIDTFPPVPYIGRLTSLQILPEFHVTNKEGCELSQLEELNGICGPLRIVGLENVRNKDEAVAARLSKKLKLRSLFLKWTGPIDSTDSASSSTDLDVEVIEALQPPPYLEELVIDGYSGSQYPTWMEDRSTMQLIQSLRIINCNALEALPSNFSQFNNCTRFIIADLGAFKELPSFSENLAELYIIRCPCLVLIPDDEMQQQDGEFQGIAGHPFLTFYYGNWKAILKKEVKIFEQIDLVDNYSEQLQIIESSIKEDNIAPEPELWETISRAWWDCHQQRMKFIFSGTTKRNILESPIKLRTLYLSYCCISDGGLSHFLRFMKTLEELTLETIMTITTLPTSDVMCNLGLLRVINIIDCWYLRSLCDLYALPYLQKFRVEGCWCLETTDHANPSKKKTTDHAMLPPSLQTFTARGCTIPDNILRGNFLCLQDVEINTCMVSRSLSFKHLKSLRSLRLVNCLPLRFIELGHISETLQLTQLPGLDVQSVAESWQGCRYLTLDGSSMLNVLLKNDNIVAPLTLTLDNCQEETISFEESDHLQSIEGLVFARCETKNLPTNLGDFSKLENIIFLDCLNILELPELPSSVQGIKIINCPVLRERCRPNGSDWHKIQHIKIKWIV